MKQSFPEKCRHVQAGALAVLAMFFIWLPALDSFVHFDKSPAPNENRTMARFPEFQSGLENLGKYIAGLEQYYNDHFGFRKRLIRLQHLWKHDLFKNQASSNDAIIGRDGWLFISNDKTIENMQGINPFAPGQLEAWKKLLESHRDWCVRHGCAYIFVIPPDKQTIYPEHLPIWLPPAKKPTKLDQFIAYMTTNSTVPILDLRPTMLNARTNGVGYFLTDSHWNYLGAFEGYQSLITALSSQLPGLKPLPLDAFQRKLVPEGGQDLAKNFGQEESMTEPANVVFSPRPPLKPLTGIMDTSLMVKNGKMNTTTENPDGKGKVVLFHDSYAVYWVPFLGYNFNKVIYTWQPNWDMHFLEQQKPDVIIDELLERHVIGVDPTPGTLKW
jgi:alginate O-acetyltransferase complex protein AlgJ